jgi:Tol biopolymer transport system component
MDPQRWARIESLYHSALAKTPDERPRYLAAVCAEEPEIQREVESLLLGASEQMSVGKRLGSYEIIGLLGAGGMGEVYRARDTRLKREVALKVLPEIFANDPERMARFQREAEVLASINHPNIAHIYGLEQRAIVMELVEGETLASPLHIDTALNYARQIAEALEYAHETGVIHRDLKPANIKVTPEGVVKLLDFGLAKAVEDPTAPSSDPSKSPTMTIGATRAGMILGTAAYMSPEQAAGKPVDRRSDIWSFGAVLYEMFAGKCAFQGESVTETLANVLKSEPDWNALPAAMPASIRNLLRRCLKKDRKQRLQAIGDVRITIEEALAGTVDEPAAQPATAHRTRSHVLGAVAALLGVTTITLGVALWRSAHSVDRPLLRLNVDLGTDSAPSRYMSAVISPDGTRLVYFVKGSDGNSRLATRLLDQPKATILAGTEGAEWPFFSPNGRWIGFFADRKMKKISVQGGAPVTLCDAVRPFGASWSEEGNIILAVANTATQNSPFAGYGGLWRVPEAGGMPDPLTNPADRGDKTHRWPQILPGGKTVLFTADAGQANEAIDVLNVKTHQWQTVHRGGHFGRYLPSGHLLYIHQDTLFAIPFQATSLRVSGAPEPILEDLASNPVEGSGPFAFSQTGTFVYSAGRVQNQPWQLAWLDSAGKIKPVVSSPGHYFTPHVSPDGKRLALAVGDGGTTDIWIYDFERENMLRLTTTAQNNRAPIWTPDGKHLAFACDPPGGQAICWIRADGVGETQRLIQNQFAPVAFSFSPDGKVLACWQSYSSSRASTAIWMLPLDLSDPDNPRPGKPEFFLGTPFHELHPVFSPDGHWIAYTSDASGVFEIYVRPFPGPGGQWQVSVGGGYVPMWSHDGHLFYEGNDNRIMVVDYTVKGNSFEPGKPRVWSNTQVMGMGLIHNVDLARDGKHVIVFPKTDTVGSEKGPVQVTFLLNFFDYLRQRAPQEK